MSRIVVIAAISVLVLFGVVGCTRSTAPSEADSAEPVPPASAEATAESTSDETPEQTHEEAPEPASGEYDGPTAPQPVGEMVPLDRGMKESCAARAGVPVPGPDDPPNVDDGRRADPEYLECLAAEGEAVNEMLNEGRSVEEILEARYGE